MTLYWKLWLCTRSSDLILAAVFTQQAHKGIRISVLPAWQRPPGYHNNNAFLTKVSVSVRPMYKCNFFDTRSDFVLQAVTLCYKLWLCTASSDLVLQALTLYYQLWICTIRCKFVLKALTLYYKLWLCTTSSDFVLQALTLYYKLCLSTTSSDFVL